MGKRVKMEFNLTKDEKGGVDEIVTAMLHWKQQRGVVNNEVYDKVMDLFADASFHLSEGE